MRPGDYTMIVQLAGDYIGVLLSCRHNRRDQGGMDGKSDWFWLWDWVQGTCLAVSLAPQSILILSLKRLITISWLGRP